MDLNEAIRHAIDGNAILFMGSGFSYKAKNLENKSPMTGRAFARHLYELCGVDTDDDNLALASQCYLGDKVHGGALGLVDLCRNVFSIREAASHHEAVLSLPWHRIYTTNYDDLAEKSAANLGKQLVPVTLSDAPEGFLSGSRVCLHINGLITRLTQNDLTGGFKLTAASYLVDEFNASPWSTVFRQDLQLARAVIFIGYSMYDLDIQRIVHVEDTKNKAIFITSPDKNIGPDKLFLPTFGDVYPIGIEEFANQIKLEQKTHTPSKQLHSFLALEKVDFKLTKDVASNSDIEKLFLYGEVNRSLVNITSAKDEQKRAYLIERTHRQKILDALEQGDDAVVISDLGNGKTILLDQLALRLGTLGWNVFRVKSDSKEALKEAQHAMSLPGHTVFVIDNYIPLLKFIDFVAIRRTGKPIGFLLGARSHVHDAYLDRLELALHVRHVAEFEINQLDKRELAEIVDLIDSYGLWAEFSAKSDSEKDRLVTKDCNSQLHQILLKLYRSPNIAEKISDLFTSIQPSVRRVAIAAFIIRGSGITLDRRSLDDLLKNSPFIRLSNTDRESVKFLWSETSGQIRLRSSVLAEFYLTSLGDAGEVVDVLTEMYLQALERTDVRSEYQYFLRSVMSFSALQKLLPETGLRAATVRFYEAIQNTKVAKKNPHYWLQYAIARLSFDDDLDDVEPYFKAAYAYAKGSNYDPYQIDNHYARFLLKKATREQNAAVAFDYYLQAKSIIQKQILRETKHYPYRVAAGVVDYLGQHRLNMDDKQHKDVVGFCEEVLKRIDKLPRDIQSHVHVIACKRAMQAAIETS